MLKIDIDDQEFIVEHNNGTVRLNGSPVDWDVQPLSERAYHIIYKGKSYTVLIETPSNSSKELKLRINGKVVEARAAGKLDLLLHEMGIDATAQSAVLVVNAPMPGRITQVMVKREQDVLQGDPLLILEAMKMENVIKSPGDGTVDKVEIKEGDSVEKNQLLISFKA